MAGPLPADVALAMKTASNIVGGYILIREIGRGGMGSVYKAWQIDLQRYVAVKFLLGAEEESHLKRFYREAHTAATLSHHNLCQVYEINQFKGRHFIVMEFVDGFTMEQLFKARKRLPVKRLVGFLRDVARSVHFAHEKGVIHRDIKPPNIMVNKQGKPFVMDFGLARPQKHGHTLTQEGVIVGSPSYMSPEQATGQVDNLKPATDIWGLGAILYETLTGRPPFQGRTAIEILTRVVNKDVVPPRSVVPEVPSELEAICMKALQKAPEERYETAREFADELNRWLKGGTVRARKFTKVQLAKRWVARRPQLVGSVVGGLAICAVLLFFIVSSKGELAEKEKELEKQKKVRAAARELFETGKIALDKAERLLFVPDVKLDDLQRHLKEALNQFDAAGEVDPGWSEIYRARGRAWELMPDPDKSDENYSQAIALDPNAVSARYDRARLRFSRYINETYHVPPGNDQRSLKTPWFEKAREDMEVAQLNSPNPADQKYVEALLLSVTKETPKVQRAVEIIDEAIAMDGTKAEYHYVRAASLNLMNRSEDAEASINRALALRPTYADALAIKAAVLNQLGRPEESLESINRAIELDPHSLFFHHIRFGTYFWYLKDYEKAKPILDANLKRNPDNVFIISSMCDYFLMVQNWDEAERYADLLFERAKEWSEAWAKKALILAYRGDMPGAEEWCNRGLRNNEASERLLLLRSEIRARRKDPIGSLTDLDLLVKLRPEVAKYHFRRGEMRAHLSNLEKAIESFEEVIRLDPKQEPTLRPRIEKLQRILDDKKR